MIMTIDLYPSEGVTIIGPGIMPSKSVTTNRGEIMFRIKNLVFGIRYHCI